jgi:hypothetical protein
LGTIALDFLQGGLNCTANWIAQINVPGQDFLTAPLENIQPGFGGATLISNDGSLPNSLIGNQVQSLFLSIPLSSSVNVDLSTIYNILNQNGGSDAFARTLGVLIELLNQQQDPLYGTACSEVDIYPAASNPFKLWLKKISGGGTDVWGIQLLNGEWTAWGAQGNTGKVITSGAGTVTIANIDSSNAATVRFTLFGNAT